MKNSYPFELEALPYGYGALEPFVDEKTMRLHHDRHLLGYVNNLNAAIREYPELYGWSLERLLCFSQDLPEKIRVAVLNNGGGVFNHNFYFRGMAPCEDFELVSDLMRAIVKEYGSFESFKSEFKARALAVFGSGYCWLAVDENDKLQIIGTANQDTILKMNMRPVLLIDVWEHAYYLKNYNLRAEYVDNWFNVVDWRQAETNYNLPLFDKSK